MRRLLAQHSPLLILAALSLALAVYSDDFRTAGNLSGVAQRSAFVGILAVGQLLVILTGGIDLSVGSVAALAGVCGAIAMRTAAPAIGDPAAIALGMATGIAVGAISGAINGGLVTKGRIPPFIVTLGMMMMARGATLILSEGQQIYGLPAAFAWLGGAKGWYVPVALTLACMAAVALTLNTTRFGRALYAIGGNLHAAHLSGVSVDGARALAYTLSGAFAGLAGMVLTSRTSVAAPTAAEMAELDAIAACVIGGASLMGGAGSAIAAVCGALIMSVLQNFCNLENINVYWQRVLIGMLIIGLVFYDTLRRRRAGLLRDSP